MQSGCWQWPLAGCFRDHMMEPLACGSLCTDTSAPASQNVGGRLGRRRLTWLLTVPAQERLLPEKQDVAPHLEAGLCPPCTEPVAACACTSAMPTTVLNVCDKLCKAAMSKLKDR